ncbi:MAG: methyltransferase domain-containing protein [Rhizomicrobium sp.]|jgi:ubiquinone/menaquinone biosynthesis C-methylase UbiE
MEAASPLNADQIEFWNGPAGQRWAAYQERMDATMIGITDAAVPFARARRGERVLDIGCGAGTTTFLLAMEVAPDGLASGIDISEPMLNVARARAQAQNADIAFLEADASVYDFQPVFDLVFSRFGVMFFAEPVTAFVNIRKALANDGRLAFVCWRSPQENLWASVPMMAAKHLLPPQEPVDPYAPGPFAFAEKDRLSATLRDAGFRDIHVEPFDSVMNIGVTSEDASAMMLDIGPLARAARELDESLRANIREAVARALAGYKTPAGVTPPAAVWLVGAKG